MTVRSLAPSIVLVAVLLTALSTALPARDHGKTVDVIATIPGPGRVLEIEVERYRTRKDRGPDELEAAMALLRARRSASGAPQFFMRNGNVVRGELVEGSLPIRTPYGTLSVPLEDLIEVRFSLRIGSEAQQRIDSAVRALADDSFEVREKASSELTGLGIDAIPALRVASKSTDEEVRVRSERLLDELEILAIDDGSGSVPLLQGHDLVSTTRLTIEGAISTDTFRLRTAYGELGISRGDVVRIRFRSTGPVETTVSVPSSAVLPGGWIRTRLQVQRGQRLVVSATGQMGVTDWGEFCGPAGLTSRASREYPGMQMLSLVGKVARSTGTSGGTPFLIGPEFKGRAPAAGTLYLGVVPFRYSATVVGSYSVKVAVR